MCFVLFEFLFEQYFRTTQWTPSDRLLCFTFLPKGAAVFYILAQGCCCVLHSYPRVLLCSTFLPKGAAVFHILAWGCCCVLHSCLRVLLCSLTISILTAYLWTIEGFLQRYLSWYFNKIVYLLASINMTVPCNAMYIFVMLFYCLIHVVNKTTVMSSASEWYWDSFCMYQCTRDKYSIFL